MLPFVFVKVMLDLVLCGKCRAVQLCSQVSQHPCSPSTCFQWSIPVHKSPVLHNREKCSISVHLSTRVTMNVLSWHQCHFEVNSFRRQKLRKQWGFVPRDKSVMSLCSTGCCAGAGLFSRHGPFCRLQSMIPSSSVVV